jgi:hypothetical protein
MTASLEQRQRIAARQERAYAALDRAATREQQAFLAKCRKLAAKPPKPAGAATEAK